MIVLSAKDLSKVYGVDVIIEKVSFHLNQGDRVGIVGRNGAGKTTLLNMITGEMKPDEGDVFVSQNLKVGYLKQRDNFDTNLTVIEAIDGIFGEIHMVEKEIERVAGEIDKNPTDELIKKLNDLHDEYDRLGGYTYKSEITGVLSSMKFTEDWYGKKINQLSGGERTRLSLAALLLEKPDILLLDEPTNHLDIDTLRWLEQYLAQYRGTIMIVSHDRYFLDQVVNRIFEISNHHLSIYEGNYTDYQEKRRKKREAELKAYEIQQKEIRRQEDIIRIMKEHNTEHLVKRAQSREKRLEMIERLEKPESEMGKMKIHFHQNFQSGQDVILMENVSKEFYDIETRKRKELFSGISMDIKRGEKICIVGPNGVGKTTLIKMIMGDGEPSTGRIKLGHNVAFGYYDQGQLLLNNSNTVLEELKDAYRLYTDTEMRSILGRFLFTGDDVFLQVGSLSGGEKARLSLVKMMLSGANTLILDEPTNHMDIESKEVFEEALMDFPGTAIIVSHDRYFLKKIPSRILELTPTSVIEYLGQYDYYLEKKDERSGNVKTNEESTGVKNSEEERRLSKEREADERRKKREIERLEAEIEKLEGLIFEIEGKLGEPEVMSDYVKLASLSEELKSNKDILDDVYKKWGELTSD